MLLDMRSDVPTIRNFVAQRVADQKTISEPIIVITFGYQVTQAGLLLVHFDTRDQVLHDGRWTVGFKPGAYISLEHWAEAASETETSGGSFIIPTGERRDIPAGPWDPISQVFGEGLLSIGLDAIARGTFDPLRLRDECELQIADFDGYWDNGSHQVLRTLPAKPLAC